MAAGATTPAREGRQVWLELIDRAQVHGRAVEAGGVVERFEAAHLVRLVSKAQRAPFPLSHASASSASKAFLQVAGAFVVAAREHDREVLAKFMVAGARCLDAILTAHAHAQAATWRRNFPDEEL